MSFVYSNAVVAIDFVKVISSWPETIINSQHALTAIQPILLAYRTKVNLRKTILSNGSGNSKRTRQQEDWLTRESDTWRMLAGIKKS